MSTLDRPVLRVAFATGTSPEKWFRRFRSRIPAELQTQSLDDPMAALTNATADMALVRLEIGAAVPDSLHRIRLYDEAWGVAFAKDHVFSVAERVPVDLLAEETVLLTTATNVDAIRSMLPVAATGAGVVVGPRTVLKALSKKAVTSADLVAEEGEEPSTRTSVWLVWPKAEDDELRQEFVGIVQGRREGSTRSQLAAGVAPAAPKKLSAREKALAKQARRGHGNDVGKRLRSGGGARGRRGSGHGGKRGNGRGAEGGGRGSQSARSSRSVRRK